MDATQKVADRRFRWVTIMAWTAWALSALALIANMFASDSGLAQFGRGSIIAALVGWGFLLAMRLRLRSIMAHNDEEYATLFEAHPQPIFLADNDTLDIVGMNRSAREKYGYTSEELPTLTIFDLHMAEDWEDAGSAWAETGATARQEIRVWTHMTKEGTTFAAEVLSTTLELKGRRVRMTVVTDVTERDEALAETLESGTRYRQIVETAKEGILTVDADMTISAVNKRTADMLGYPSDELVGHRISEFAGLDGTELAKADAGHWAERRLTGERETTFRRKDGTVVSVLLNESPLLDREGNYAGQLSMITDLTERKGFENERAFKAIHDPLTGLPNRLLLVDRLQLALGRTNREELGVAVAFIDVDGFKDVNAAYGNSGGDALLVQMADRLSSATLERDTVARFGGDEFVVVSDRSGLFAENLVDQLKVAMAAPYSIGDAQINVTACIGVAVGEFGDRPGPLLRDADIALRHAKGNGRDHTEFFTEALRATSSQRLELVSDLQQAVVRHEFSLRFQPVVSLVDAAIIGAEALIRWEHPQRGTLDPHEFISIAEETGLIGPIGQWVIEETCRQFAAWQRLVPNLSMSLNISANQLTTEVLYNVVGDAIRASGADPSHLALEITEAVLTNDVAPAVRALTAVRETGVAISIDDFGTGYSSLSRLKRFPIDILKIDQSFVAGLPDDAYDCALVQAILAIGDALDLSVIAEGVENEAQAAALLELGCEKAQGYHYYQPLTAEAFEAELVASRQAGAIERRVVFEKGVDESSSDLRTVRSGLAGRRWAAAGSRSIASRTKKSH